MKSLNFKIFSILLVLSLISVICVLPYVLTLQGELLKTLQVPIEVLFAAQFTQTILLFAITIFLGLFLSKKTGFQLPLLEAIATKGNSQKILKNILRQSVLLGIVAAVLIYALDSLFTMLGVNISTHQNPAPAWQKLLAAVYGGVTEEIVMRLFFMTLLIWIGMKLFRQNKPMTVGIWISIFLAAIIFGLGHLPITASLTEINTLVVSRAVVLNGVGGIIFGWLFWKKGLESAMIAHFTADIFLLTLLPLLIK